MYHILQIYFAFSLNFRNYLQLLFSLWCTPWCTLLCTPWFAAETLGWKWSFGRSASAAPLKMTWHSNWISHTTCHYFSACERWTLSWTQNSPGNPHPRICGYMQPQGLHRIGCLLQTWVVMWVLHFNPGELLICCKIEKLAGSISEERARQSGVGLAGCCLSSFSDWPVMSSSVCPLPKSRKWRKHSESTGSVMLIFCHFVIAWRVTWNRRICRNNLSQVNYTLSCALETTV